MVRALAPPRLSNPKTPSQRAAPPSSPPQPKKQPFIDKATAAHFHLVHRSQRDPKSADPNAPQRVLAPLPETGNQARKSVRGSQSTRAVLEEQVWPSPAFSHTPDCD